MDMIDTWIAYCDRSKADDKVLSDCLTALRDESGVNDSPKMKTTKGDEERAELISSGKETSTKEAHEEPDEVKAPEETADDEAALGKESTTEAPYEERVEACVDRFRNKAHGSRDTKETAKAKAAPKEDSSAKAPLKKIEFLKGETMKGTFPEKKAAPRDRMIEESSLTRTEAAKKDSLATEEGGPRDQVGSSDDEGAFEDRCLNNDNFEGGTTHPELWALLQLGPPSIVAPQV